MIRAEYIVRYMRHNGSCGLERYGHAARTLDEVKDHGRYILADFDTFALDRASVEVRVDGRTVYTRSVGARDFS